MAPYLFYAFHSFVIFVLFFLSVLLTDFTREALDGFEKGTSLCSKDKLLFMYEFVKIVALLIIGDDFVN